DGLDLLDRGREARERLRRRTVLRRANALDDARVVGARGEAVDGLRREDDELALAQGARGLLDRPRLERSGDGLDAGHVEIIGDAPRASQRPPIDWYAWKHDLSGSTSAGARSRSSWPKEACSGKSSVSRTRHAGSSRSRERSPM